ncbi:MAG: alpha/beta hydrolase, partial [Sphingopyxis sp.]
PPAPSFPMPIQASAPAQPGTIPLYAPTPGASADTERWFRMGADLAVRNVTAPTITPILPDPARATGAAVIVAPGGAFMMLAMDSEGWRVAHALADQGIAAFVLKYRLNPTPADHAAGFAAIGQRFSAAIADPLAPPAISEPRATQDALAALAMVRTRAAQWGVDPARVGMIGFSAGAMTSLNAALADDAAARPAYFGYIYGPMLPITVPVDAPPMFAAIALDDGLFREQGLAIVDSWRRAGRPVELHAYERGDHGFGLGRAGTTSTGLVPQFIEWMRMHGLLQPAATRP